MIKKILCSLCLLVGLWQCTTAEDSNNIPVNNEVGNKEVIVDSEAKEFYRLAQEESEKGIVGWDNALKYYNQANEIEPENPIILHARGRFKIMSEIDIPGGFEDHAAAIRFSTDSLNLKARYSNRALDFLKIRDICSACNDWERAGDSEKYINKYCDRDFNAALKSNVDDRLSVILTLSDSVYYTRSNPYGELQSGFGKVLIENHSHSLIKLENMWSIFGHETNLSKSLYLEAIDSTGKKFHFFCKRTYTGFGNNEVYEIPLGGSFEFEEEVFRSHYLPYTGKYSVRVALRPSKHIQGLTNVYFSNWVDIIVDRKDIVHPI